MANDLSTGTDVPVRFRDDVTVDLIKHSASDSDVLWAARVSTACSAECVAAGSPPAAARRRWSSRGVSGRARSAAGIATSGACPEIPVLRVRARRARRWARRNYAGYFESFRISRAAFAPEPPVRPVPGCVPEPHRYSPWTGVR